MKLVDVEEKKFVSFCWFFFIPPCDAPENDFFEAFKRADLRTYLFTAEL